ncbi:MAG: hypothetical protein KDJ27_15475 [Gammaproteobacteria bacterium]|nr:hypothetical protein [Gammaproteobacteria bacterium]
MSDTVEVNVAGRLMLLLTKQGLLANRCLSIYRSAVNAAVLKQLQLTGENYVCVEKLIDRELALLEVALSERAAQRARGPSAVDVGADVVPAEPASPAAQNDIAQDDAGKPAHARRDPRASSGYVPEVKSMEDKLRDERTPIQALLREDCVQVGLIDPEEAKRLVLGMSGKSSQQAEQDIVERLRQRLQDQVKSFIRRAKGGPWSDPRTQEDLRKDIHTARSVRSVLMLSRQVLKEYQTWEAENRSGGILGLFSSRKRTVQR